MPVARLVAAAVSLALIALLVLLFVDDRFYVRAAKVHGMHYTAQSDVYRLAGVDAYSVFWVDGQRAARQIETLPFVKRALVRPLLPDRVRIDLEERVPAVVWRVNGRDLWVDTDGITLPVVSQLDGLPVLEDQDGSSIGEGGGLEPQLVAGVLTLQNQLPEVNRFAYDRSRGLHFGLPDGTQVTLGQPAGVEQRVKELSTLRSALAGRGSLAREIDLRYEGGYYYR